MTFFIKSIHLNYCLFEINSNIIKTNLTEEYNITLTDKSEEEIKILEDHLKKLDELDKETNELYINENNSEEEFNQPTVNENEINLFNEENIEFNINDIISTLLVEDFFYNFIIKKIYGIYFEFDSYLLETSEFGTLNKFRLLEVNREAILPTRIATKILVTSQDVLHSFSLPYFGIKIDAVPGRINHFNFENLKSGHYYGQCSELCGSRHGMMPIGIKTFPDKNFDNFFTIIIILPLKHKCSNKI